MAAPKPNNPNVIKVSMIFVRDTREFINTFHVSAVGGWTLLQMQQAATDFASWWNLFYKLACANTVSLVQVQVRLLNPANPLAVDFPVSPPVAGAIVQAAAPADVTLTTSWRTGLAGRAFRGRVYAPGITVGHVTSDDRVDSTVVSLLASAAANLISGALSRGALTVFHQPLAVPKALDNTFTDVLTFVIENIIDSQRRRLPGRGR